MLPEKIVKGLVIDPVRKTTSVVEYDGNDRFSVEDHLKVYSYDFRIIEENDEDDNSTGRICMFYQSNQKDLIFNKPFSIDDNVFFGTGFIVKLGDYQGDYDFNTETLTEEEIIGITSMIGFNLKINYKERVVYEIESIEEIEEEVMSV